MHRTRTPARGADSLVATNSMLLLTSMTNVSTGRSGLTRTGTREPDSEVGEGAVLSALCLSTHLKLSAN